MKIDASNRDVYWQGFRDGMKCKNGVDSTFYFMDYSAEQIADLITKDQEEKYQQWKSGELRMDQEKINARQKREEFRAFLTAKWGSAAQVESSRIMEYYDAVHCLELLKKSIVINIVNEENVVIQRNGKLVYEDKK